MSVKFKNKSFKTDRDKDKLLKIKSMFAFSNISPAALCTLDRGLFIVHLNASLVAMPEKRWNSWQLDATALLWKALYWNLVCVSLLLWYGRFLTEEKCWNEASALKLICLLVSVHSPSRSHTLRVAKPPNSMFLIMSWSLRTWLEHGHAKKPWD